MTHFLNKNHKPILTLNWRWVSRFFLYFLLDTYYVDLLLVINGISPTQCNIYRELDVFRWWLILLCINLAYLTHYSGIHTKAACSEGSIAGNIRQQFKGQRYFPRVLHFNNKRANNVRKKKNVKGNGGWGDYRDRQMCLAIANHTISELTLQKLQFENFIISWNVKSGCAFQMNLM